MEKTRRRGLRLLTENGVAARHDGSLVALLVETIRVSGGGWHIVQQPTFGEDVYTYVASYSSCHLNEEMLIDLESRTEREAFSGLLAKKICRLVTRYAL